MNIAEIIDWSIALVPVLLMAALFAWLDVFKLMRVWEMLGLLMLGGVGGAGRLADQRPDARHAADGLQLLQPDGRAVDRGGAEGRWRSCC